MPRGTPDERDDEAADWHRRVVGRSLRTAAERSVDRGKALIRAAAVVLERANGEDITVQDVADEAGQSLRTLYQYFESKDDLLLAVFEEAMRTYAQLLRTAIEDLDAPLDRLAGAIVAAVSMPAFSETGFDRGLARLRLRLAESRPELVGRAQIAVTTLIRELVEAAAAAGRIRGEDPEAATFMVLALNAAFITTERLGNDTGVGRPDIPGMVTFCLQGLGASVEPAWLDGVTAKVRLPARRPRLVPGTPRSRNGRRRATGAKRPARKA
ncbi:MAG TPA: TetR/AcrR family transcriptional regulator [Acidimicrobiales bacterium]|nr:TetR/AcrR family transcriptional regulator [Acidimicrobiales bacterium]